MAITILVVDDEEDLQPLFLSRFRPKIRQQIYQFRFATNGREALDILRQEAGIDVVILDINMPEIDGLTVLAEIPSINPLLGTVIVSAYDDIKNIRVAMNRGAFDFLCKPIDFSDLELTIEKTIQHTQQLRESQQLKVLDELKTRFFDNITHELRTPLTLILSPLDQLIQSHPEPIQLHQSLRTIERHAQQLLQLINQLLDLAKLESGHLSLTPITGELGEFVGQIVRSFEPMAIISNINLTYECHFTGFTAFDAKRLEQILHNLLSNAIKFTPSGSVRIALERNEVVRLTIRDTGIGIPADQLPYIFDRFYQVESTAPEHSVTAYANPGTGIGLALVKELVELMDGNIQVHSVHHKVAQPSGSTFTIELPLLQIADPIVHSSGVDRPQLLKAVNGSPAHQPPHYPGLEAQDRPLLLLVEDNPELNDFIANALQESYRLIRAYDGNQGWEMACHEIPDLVLTDIMMPGIDGFELTSRLKSNPETDHIAVLMLTAKTTLSNRLEGLQKGADDYIVKPFHVDELRLRLHNLLTRQQKLRDHFYNQLSPAQTRVKTLSIQESFILKLTDLIEAQLDDSTFGVDELARSVGMSRRTLHRKLTAIANLPITGFIRQYRMKRALEFIQNGNTIAEVAYRVGYESPASFSTVFKEFFGESPSDYQKKERSAQ